MTWQLVTAANLVTAGAYATISYVIFSPDLLGEPGSFIELGPGDLRRAAPATIAGHQEESPA